MSCNVFWNNCSNRIQRIQWYTYSVHFIYLKTCMERYTPANTLRNNDVVITSKRHFDVITSKWRRFDVITTLLLRHVFRGSMTRYVKQAVPKLLHDTLPYPSFRANTACKIWGPFQYKYGLSLYMISITKIRLSWDTLIARFMGPTWGPSGADRTQLGPMLAPWTLLSG